MFKQEASAEINNEMKMVSAILDFPTLNPTFPT